MQEGVSHKVPIVWHLWLKWLDMEHDAKYSPVILRALWMPALGHHKLFLQ
jgi:hypothetical protein